ncbi:hypothetical protein QZH41_018720, partial [Actinostola sp. cb2023]
LLANQGIDDDSALRISNMAALPNGQQQGGNYQGGFLGGGMPYGQRVADGMEGPYGDGNYGFNPSPPQMVSDEPDAPNPQDEGSQITMSPPNDRIQKLVMKHHSKIKDAAKQNFGDEATFMSPHAHRGEASGSGADESGSGALSSVAKAVPLIPQSQGKLVSNVKTAEEASGQVTVDTKPEESAIASQGQISGDSSSTNLPGKSDQQTSKQTPDQAQTNEKSSNKVNNSASDKDNNTGSKQDSNKDSKPQDSKPQDSKPQDSKPTAGQTNKPRPSQGSDATTESHSQTNSPLGEFAKFLKAKGITLTINKGKASVQEQAEGPGNEKGSYGPPANMQQPMSSSSEVRASAGEPAVAGGRSPMNAESPSMGNAVSQDASLTNAVMNWQNVSPQANQMGELYVRHDTKQPRH